jgi:hypothetical protein
MTTKTATAPRKDKRRKSAEQKAHEAFWCFCGNPSGNHTYHDDNERRICRKHHWTCDDCGKVVQVG